MKKVLFVVGHDYSGKYEATRELFDKNYLNDILLFGCNSILERIYYKRKIIEPFNSWLKKLSDDGKLHIITSEIGRRMTATEEVDKIVIKYYGGDRAVAISVISPDYEKYSELLKDFVDEYGYGPFAEIHPLTYTGEYVKEPMLTRKKRKGDL